MEAVLLATRREIDQELPQSITTGGANQVEIFARMAPQPDLIWR